MNNSSAQDCPHSAQPAPAAGMFRWFASTKLAVALIVGVAVVLAAATFLESARGREVAQWQVYKSPWFMGKDKEGDQINAGEQIRLSVIKYFPHARQKITFHPIDASTDDASALESAVLVKVQAGGNLGMTNRANLAMPGDYQIPTTTSIISHVSPKGFTGPPTLGFTAPPG